MLAATTVDVAYRATRWLESKATKPTTGCLAISVKSETLLFRTYVDAAGCPFTW